jgi:hypothetical protein
MWIPQVEVMGKAEEESYPLQSDLQLGARGRWHSIPLLRSLDFLILSGIDADNSGYESEKGKNRRVTAEALWNPTLTQKTR